MQTLYTYADRLKVGDRQTTFGRTITEADLVNFAGLTGDHFPLHTDAKYARSTRFQQRIAHGMLVLSYMIGLLGLEPGAVVAFYGLEDVRFRRPTVIGDTLHAQIELVALQERDDATALSTTALQVLNQRGETVLSGQLKFVLARTPST